MAVCCSNVVVVCLLEALGVLGEVLLEQTLEEVPDWLLVWFLEE